MITYSNKLDMTPGGFPCVINLNQYDDDVELQFLLHSRTGLLTIQTGTTAMIRGTKRDGNAYSADATINVSSSTVTVAVTKQMTAAAGKNVFELVLLKGTKVLSTANFILQVEHAAMDADTITSDSVLKEMNALIESASTATAAAEEATEAAQSVSASAAQIEANRQAIAENASGIEANTTAVADLKDDLEELEPGLSDNAISAFLACFQRVAWTDPDSQSYYDALEEALYEGRRKLESISATYTATGHTVYPWDTLDSLRPYVIVTAIYNDGTSKPVSDYTMSGDLTLATSTIDVAYGGKTAQVSVSVGSTISLQYYMQDGTVVDGAIVDTGVKLVDTNKSVSIVADITDEEILTRVRTMFFMSDRNATTGQAQWQFSCAGSASGTDYIKNYIAIAAGAAGMQTGDKDNTAHRIKFAMIHYSNTTNYTLYLKVDDTVIYDFQSVAGSYTVSDQSLHIGGRPDGGYFWKGTVNLFGVYFRGMPISEARTILGVA